MPVKRAFKHFGKHKKAYLIGGAVVGGLGLRAGLGAGVAASVAPKGRRKKAALHGAGWGIISPTLGGGAVGIHHRIREKGARKEAIIRRKKRR